jgi:hypothetical protein
MKFKARVWKVGDNINTDLIAKPLPAPLLAIVNAGGTYPLLEKEGSIALRA